MQQLLAAQPTPGSEVVNRFHNLEKIGEGTYGTVFRAVHKKDGVKCALKMISIEKNGEGIPSTCIREISCLKDLNHPNIIRLYDVIQFSSRLYMVFELIDRDLNMLFRIIPDGRLPMEYASSFLWQILSALAYCHIRRIVHRDLKPQNILVSDSGTIKIADFGLARSFSFPSRAYSHEVVTLWYRPPEVILGCDKYSTSLDIWSIGCIFAEMISGCVLFKGDSEILQLFQIFQLIGTPTAENWPGVEKMPHYKAVFPRWEPQTDLLSQNSGLDGNGFELLKEMIRYPPCKRITAKAALSTKFFYERNCMTQLPPVTTLFVQQPPSSSRGVDHDF